MFQDKRIDVTSEGEFIERGEKIVIVRVSGKKLDDLQAIQKMLREKSLDVPLQFVNYRS